MSAVVASSTRDAIDVRAVDFRFVPALPENGSPGWFAHYDLAPVGREGWRAADVRGAVDARVEAWVDDFDAWHAALGGWAERRSPWWWLLRASRPNLWGQRAALKPLFFAAGLLEWAAATAPDGPVHVLAAPSLVADYLEELRGGAVAAVGREDGVVRPMAVALVDAARQLGALLRRYAGRRPSRLRTRVLFYSHVVEGGSFASVGDHFFGAMLDVAEGRRRDDVLLGLFLHADADRPAVEAALRARGRRACFVLDHLRVTDIVWTAGQLLHCVRAFGREPRALPPLRLGRWTSRSFPRHYFAREVRRWLPVTELAMYRAMRRLLAASGARTVVYPYEEKGVERALVRAAAERRGVRTLAYGHPVHTRAHLALRTRRGAPNPPSPDGLLATGPEAARFLVEWGGKPPARVMAVGSPRHLTPRPRTGGPRERGARLRVLVVVGHAFELTTFASLVQGRPDLADTHEVLVRSYRFNWHDEQAQAIRRLQAFAPSIRVDDQESLVDQLAWCDAVVFESTTVGVQAMLAGRLAVHTALHDVFPADPLLGHESVFARCANADALADALARAAALGEEETARIVARQRELATAILAPLDEARLVDALGLDGEPAGRG